MNAKVRVAVIKRIVAQRFVAQFVARVRRIADELAQENVAVGVKRVNHEIQHPRGFCSKGFGFVEMKDDTDANNAINALNGLEFMGRPIVANEARPREDNGNRDNNRGGGHHRKSRFDNNRDGNNRSNRGNSIA